MYKQQYLSQAESKYSEAEAEIYAQTMTAFSFSYLLEDRAALNDEGYYDKVMVTVFLRMLRLEEDEALRKQIFLRLPSRDD